MADNAIRYTIRGNFIRIEPRMGRFDVWANQLFVGSETNEAEAIWAAVDALKNNSKCRPEGTRLLPGGPLSG